MYADYITLFCDFDFDNVNLAEENITNEQVKRTEWLAFNQLSLDVNKTKSMLVHSV